MALTASAKTTQRAWAFWDEDFGDFMRIKFVAPEDQDGPCGLPTGLFRTKKAAMAFARKHGFKLTERFRLEGVYVDISF